MSEGAFVCSFICICDYSKTNEWGLTFFLRVGSDSIKMSLNCGKYLLTIWIYLAALADVYVLRVLF